MKFRCDSCKGIMAIDKSEVGKEVNCGHCNLVVTVPSPFTRGVVIDDFIIKEECRGGYLCHQISLDIPVILHTFQSVDQKAIRKFIEDARQLVKANQVHVIGSEEDLYFYAEKAPQNE